MTPPDRNGPLRMYIALRLLRAWGPGTAGFSVALVDAVHGWIDLGMEGPIPWPDDPFFAAWADERGFHKVGSAIGFRFQGVISPELLGRDEGRGTREQGLGNRE